MDFNKLAYFDLEVVNSSLDRTAILNIMVDAWIEAPYYKYLSWTENTQITESSAKQCSEFADIMSSILRYDVPVFLAIDNHDKLDKIFHESSSLNTLQTCNGVLAGLLIAKRLPSFIKHTGRIIKHIQNEKDRHSHVFKKYALDWLAEFLDIIADTNACILTSKSLATSAVAFAHYNAIFQTAYHAAMLITKILKTYQELEKFACALKIIENKIQHCEDTEELQHLSNLKKGIIAQRNYLLHSKTIEAILELALLGAALAMLLGGPAGLTVGGILMGLISAIDYAVKNYYFPKKEIQMSASPLSLFEKQLREHSLEQIKKLENELSKQKNKKESDRYTNTQKKLNAYRDAYNKTFAKLNEKTYCEPKVRLDYLNTIVETTFSASQISRTGSNRMPESEKSLRNILELFQKTEWQNDTESEKAFKAFIGSVLNPPQEDLEQEEDLEQVVEQVVEQKDALYPFYSLSDMGDRHVDLQLAMITV